MAAPSSTDSIGDAALFDKICHQMLTDQKRVKGERIETPDRTEA